MKNYHQVVSVWFLSGLLTRCVSVGETAIRTNRTLYNEAIHDTSNEQLLLNVVRAKQYDSPTFLSAVEIDGTNTASASVNGGSSMFGALTGTIGTVTGNATLSDSPISKYQSLTGAELISQVSSPILPLSISNLKSSDWNFSPLIVFTIERFTPNFLDFYEAVDILEYLDRYGAISFSSMDKDDLTISFHKNGNLNGLATVSVDPLDESIKCKELKDVDDANLQKVWKVFKNIIGTGVSDHEDRVTFGKITKDNGRTKQIMLGHSINTYSAYGALRLAENKIPFYIVKSKQDAENIALYNSNSKTNKDPQISFGAPDASNHCFDSEYYYVPVDEDERNWPAEFLAFGGSRPCASKN